MGWGLNAKEREALLTSCMISKSKGKVKAKAKAKAPEGGAAAGEKAVMVSASASAPAQGGLGEVLDIKKGKVIVVADMNAKVRQKAVDIPGSPLNLWKVVQNVVYEVAGVRETDDDLRADHTVMAFDSPDSSPIMRSGLWASRYAKPNPKFVLTEEQKDEAIAFVQAAAKCSAAARQQPPCLFGSLFQPGPLKRETWKAIEAIARRVACKLKADGKIRDFTLVSHDHTVFSSVDAVTVAGPASIGLGGRFARLGEADLKVFAVAVHFLKRPLTEVRHVDVKSVDTDLLLQTVATVGVGVPRARFTISLKGFAVDGRALIKQFGGKKASARLEAAFWWIMAGGTDYSKPASDQGYLKKAMLDLTHPIRLARDPPLFELAKDAKGADGVAFSPSAALKKLQTLRGTRKVARDLAGKTTKSGRSLSDAVREAVVCTAYYGMLDVNPGPDFCADVSAASAAKDVFISAPM